MTDRPIDPSHRSAKSRPDWSLPIRSSFLERYQAGETVNALAKVFDVNRATVFAIRCRSDGPERVPSCWCADTVTGHEPVEPASRFPIAIATMTSHTRMPDPPRVVIGRFAG